MDQRDESQDRDLSEKFRNFRMTRVSERMREGVVSPVPGTELCTITPDETLDRAARKMFRNKVSRLVVVHPQTEEPVGTISHLDLARVRLVAEGAELEPKL
jgi:CBS domain-containing protein